VPMGLPPPPSHQQSPRSNYLPPIGSVNSPAALQAHTTVLQHEVSVQKLALSSLQGEHDKLLNAFSRSQIRASTLEKKHAVSDNEIITLTEEKLRLQAQVIELERDVEELGKSRDQFRRSAVQEGAQYVEIIKKASQLEERTAEERRSWNKLKTEMEQKIEELMTQKTAQDMATSTPQISESSGTRSIGREALIWNSDSSFQRIITDIVTPASSAPEGRGDIKIEPTSDAQPSSKPTDLQPDANKDLKQEIQRLRDRCEEVENVLQTVREESRNMEGLIAALGRAGKSILERTDNAL